MIPTCKFQAVILNQLEPEWRPLGPEDPDTFGTRQELGQYRLSLSLGDPRAREYYRS